MVKLTPGDSSFHFEIKGLHKLWAFKSELEIPRHHILRAYKDSSKLEGWKGLRFLATSVPFLITAGTYYVGGGKNFWDVVNEDNCIIIDLKDEEYNSLIIEVEDPDEAIRLLSSK